MTLAGDSNTCVLFCEKCQQQFGRHGNIFQVMSEASLSILYHHGLEVCDFESDVNNNDDLEDSRYRTGGAQKQIYQLLLFHFNSY